MVHHQWIHKSKIYFFFKSSQKLNRNLKVCNSVQSSSYVGTNKEAYPFLCIYRGTYTCVHVEKKELNCSAASIFSNACLPKLVMFAPFWENSVSFLFQLCICSSWFQSRIKFVMWMYTHITWQKLDTENVMVCCCRWRVLERL